ncbi:MAG: ATP-dependent zinc metalloprotease FtsH [Gammaproteobacteria bacterium]|nr:ATP-dependent zinc metalloprotease FtsH [Gammaproteobacteria bacterium]
MGKNLLLWLIIGVVLITVFNTFNGGQEPPKEPYSAFLQQVETGQVASVTFEGQELKVARMDGERYVVVMPSVGDGSLLATLKDAGVSVEGKMPEEQSFWAQLLIASFPILIIIAVFMLFMRQMQGGMGGRGNPMTFGKSKARLLSEDEIKTTFADVAGVDEAKEDVQELVEFLRDPSKFQRLGGRIPRGTLMVGSPGTGKTLLAKAIAGEAKVPFFSISGSDFVEMFVGVGASRVRDMFEQAKKQAPCIIFIDEIDAVGRHRGAGLGGGHDEREQTLNQLLVEMDGFEANDGIIVIAATNRPDVLDPALLRPGRFDRQVVVPLPDIRGREQIMKVHMRNVPAAEDVDPSIIARGTPGFCGADLENVVNEAALFAARSGKANVEMEDFEKAKDKIMMGTERKSMVMSEKEKRNTAYHEAGHAIVGRSVPDYDELYKITIVPRGRALGVTMFLPEEDRHSLSRRSLVSQICTLFGGRVAEEMINGKDGITTGAANDIERASQLARSMVTKWGFSERMGPLLYDEDDGEVFLGMSAASQPKPVSSRTAREIDEEVRAIIDECYSTAKQILGDHEDKLHKIADALMELETLMPEQVGDIMEGKPPRVIETPNEQTDTGAEDAQQAPDTDVPPSESAANRRRPKPGPIGRPAEEH